MYMYNVHCTVTDTDIRLEQYVPEASSETGVKYSDSDEHLSYWHLGVRGGNGEQKQTTNWPIRPSVDQTRNSKLNKAYS